MATKRSRSSEEASDACELISQTLPVAKKTTLHHYFTNAASTCTRFVVLRVCQRTRADGMQAAAAAGLLTSQLCL